MHVRVAVFISIVIVLYCYQTVCVDTLSIEIKGGVSGVLGENGTEIECSYTRKNVRRINRVDIMAFNRSSVAFEIIAAYLPDVISTLLPQGQYLKGRVTLPSITQSSTKAVMIFNNLKCIDDTFYKCKVTYTDDSLLSQVETSGNMSIQVHVTPSKPDAIFLIKVPADVSSTTLTVPMSATTSSSSSAETISTMDIDEQNDKTASTHTTIQTTDHNTTSSTHSGEDHFIDSSYRITTYSLQQSTTAQGLAEGDNITVVCTGNVGNPSAEHVFQKYRKDLGLFMTYTASQTSEISANCSYYRTSNLTFTVSANDNHAVIRCVVNSSMADPDMYVDTAPIEVYYEVSMPTIIKYPNKAFYVVSEDTSILLTCKSDGNPKPYYQWYKENNELISRNESWTIMDINATNSGIYTCNISNTFNGYTYTKAKHVQIYIMNKADIATSTTFRTSVSNKTSVIKQSNNENTAVIVVGTVFGSIILVICMILFRVLQNKNKTCICLLKRNRNDRSVDYVNTIHQQDPSLYEGVGQALDEHNYEQLSRMEHVYNNTNLSNN